MAALQMVKGTALTDLASLRAQIGAIDLSQKTKGGALVELVGPTCTQEMVSILVERQKAAANTLALWCESEFSVYPIGLLQQGVDLSRLLFVEATKDVSWVLGQALQSQLFPTVIAANYQFHEKELRRLQLLSERANTTTFLLKGATLLSRLRQKGEA